MSRIVLGATGAPLNSTFIAGLQCKVLDAYGQFLFVLAVTA